MNKSFENAIELVEITENELEKINKYSLKELTQDEVFTFSVQLCDNEIDRDFECFDLSALKALAPLMVGKTGIYDHEMKSENQVARIYAAEVEESEEKFNSKGEKYARIKAKAYMLKNEKNECLISEICAGIKKEVSISCAVKEHICSECGANVRKKGCAHVKGRDCHHILRKPYDAYEWSFVAVPAQRSAGTVKGFSDALETEKLREIAEKYRSFLESEIVRMTSSISPEISMKSVKNICESLTVEALEELRCDYVAAESKKIKPQSILKKTAAANDNFKI